MRELTPSKQLLAWCLFFIVGLVIGSFTDFNRTLLIYLSIAWGLVYFSKQEPTIELLSLILFAATFGLLLWQITGGEPWLKIGFLEKVTNILIDWRDVIVTKIFLALPEPHGSLLAGILLGNKVKLSKDLLDQFKIIGVTHLIAVSGYNLTILTANIRSLFRPVFGLKAIYICLLAIIFFVLITGAPASILRAAAMAIIVLLAEYLGRPARTLNLLIIGVVVLTIFEPAIITDIGFQLSVAATYGLLRLSPALTYILQRWRIPKTLAQILGETLAATVMTAPIILFYFERLSLISPLANLLMLPLIPLLMGLGLFGIVALLIWQPLGGVVTLLSWPILAWIVGVSKYLSSYKFASLNLQLPNWGIILILIFVVIGSECVFKLNESKQETDVTRFV